MNMLIRICFVWGCWIFLIAQVCNAGVFNITDCNIKLRGTGSDLGYLVPPADNQIDWYRMIKNLTQDSLRHFPFVNTEITLDTATVFAKDLISTEYYEHGSPEFSKDGKQVLWTQLLGEHGSEAVVKYMSYSDGKWSKPLLANFLKGFDDMYPKFSYDGNKLFFSAGSSIEKKEGTERRGIWFIDKIEEGWSVPNYVGFDSLDIYGLSIADNGNIYFMARRLFDEAQYDIYCTKYFNGEYLSPTKIDFPISTEYYEDGPYISNDESYLLFESTRPGGFGGVDIYFSRKQINGSWGEPTNPGEIINSKANERFPSISPDGKYFFFGSDRNGNWDVYWIPASSIGSIRD